MGGRLVDSNGTARWLASITFGQLLTWDIPCGLGLVPSMSGDFVMLGHHIVMAFVAYCGMFHIPSYYYLFFFGFCEISSIPLAVVDFFHPKHFQSLAESSSFLSVVNEISRYSFAALFLMVRALYFPYVVVFMLMPDI